MRSLLIACVCVLCGVHCVLAQNPHVPGAYGHAYAPSESGFCDGSCACESQTCSSTDFCDPCDLELCFDDRCRESGGWGWYVDFLLLKPTVDDTYFVLNSPQSTTFPNGLRLNNDFDHEPGIRIGAMLWGDGDGADFQIDYTWLEADTTRTVAGDFLWATVGRSDFASAFENYAGTATSELDLAYNAFNAQFSRPLQALGSNVSFLYGAEFVKLDYDLRYEFDNAQQLGTIVESAETWGLGAKLGLSGDHVVRQTDSGYWSFTWMSAVSLLAGESDGSHVNRLNGATQLNVVDDDTARLIPALHARLGMSYSREILDRPACLAFGYEYHSYIRAIARTTGVDDVADGQLLNTYTNFDLQGFFASLTFYH